MLRKKTLTGSLLAVCCLLLPAASALAVTSGGFGGRPANPDPSNPRTESIFIYTLEGGEQKEDQVLLTNNSDEEAKISLYAVDGVTTNTGAYTCKQQSEARTGIGEWLRLSEEVVTLAPSEKKLIDFTLTMPENADVGEHNGCIVFENAEDEGEDVEGGAVRVRTRSAIRVAATIPGELRRNIEIDTFSADVSSDGDQEYALTLQNNGNVSADVDTKITLKDMFGNQVYENGGGYPVFANQKLDINFTNTDRPFWGGWFKARASISYDKRAGTFGTENTAELITKESDEITMFLMPSTMALAIIAVPLLILLGVVMWLIWRSIARRRAEKQWGSYKVVPGDTIESIAATHDVRWKKLAAINDIKAPYVIHEGQIIKVPEGEARVVSGPRSTRPVVPVSDPIDEIEEDDIDKLVSAKAKKTNTKKK